MSLPPIKIGIFPSRLFTIKNFCIRIFVEFAALKFCFKGPLVSIARSVGLHCRAVGSHIAKDNSFGQNWIKPWEVAESTNLIEWKRLFVNGCRCSSLISMAMECLNMCQGGTNASIY